MKLEMGESLFYSWLRHVKECQIVQTNWKPSPSWPMQRIDALEQFMHTSSAHFSSKYGYTVFKTKSLSQIITQAEIDALGVSLSSDGQNIYAVDVAFHEGGLNYGDRTETVARIIMKFLRTAICLIGYFNYAPGEIIFASPKVSLAYISDLEPCVADLNALFIEHHLPLTARIIANEEFNEHVLKQILIASEGVADTSELFMRAYQLVNMFSIGSKSVTRLPLTKRMSEVTGSGSVAELKIGRIAQTLLRELLESGVIDEAELQLLQTKPYSKQRFDLDFPLLVKLGSEHDPVRYYDKPLIIRGVSYLLCSQWYEIPANNDRPYLLAWLEQHDVCF